MFPGSLGTQVAGWNEVQHLGQNAINADMVAISVGTTFLPGIGQVDNLIQAFTGKDPVTGEDVKTPGLTPTESRWLAGLSVIPGGAIADRVLRTEVAAHNITAAGIAVKRAPEGGAVAAAASHDTGLANKALIAVTQRKGGINANVVKTALLRDGWAADPARTTTTASGTTYAYYTRGTSTVIVPRHGTSQDIPAATLKYIYTQAGVK